LKGYASSPSQDQVLSIPLQLRGRPIGKLKIKSSDSTFSLTDDERAIAEATAERAAIALEGARLLDEAQKRALRESFLSEMGARLSTSFQLDSILRDTVEELGQTLKGSSISFQLVDPSTLPPMDSVESDDSTLDGKNSQ
jgi:GAF domain-containing protein